MTAPRVIAIVPAAGHSRRMGVEKLLLDVHAGETPTLPDNSAGGTPTPRAAGRPMLLAVLVPLRTCGLAGVVVVTRQDIARRLGLETRFDAPGAPEIAVAYNDDPATEMIDSIRIGLRTCDERFSPRSSDGLLVCPADQPGISAADHAACIAAFRAAPQRIIIAVRAGRRGHPIVFPAALRPFVESAACDTGLRALPKAMPERVLEIACTSPGVTRDVNTPGDYEAL